MTAEFRLLQRFTYDQHEFSIYEVDGDWLSASAREYADLRTAVSKPIQDIRLDGLEVIDVEKIRERLRRAAIPTRRPGHPFDVVRSDFGEVLAYLILETSYGTAIGYKSVRDRELVQWTGRGIDVIGVEYAGTLSLVLGEAKVSGEDRSPPGVVDRDEGCLRDQHQGHIANHPETVRKLWDVARRTTDERTRDLLIAAALLFEDQRWSDLRLVVCSILVRPRHKHTDKDFGSFREHPEDYEPGCVRFIVITIPGEVDPIVDEWYRLVS